MNSSDIYLTPKQIVSALDQYVIGQDKAKKQVAIALRNRWRRLKTEGSMRKEINPNNILMIGSTGVGKTEIARRISKMANAPFVKVEASKFTEVGYVGRDVESMVRDLLENSIKQVRALHMEKIQKQAEQVAEDIIIGRLVFSPKTATQEDDDMKLAYEKAKEFTRQRLQKGELDDKEIEISIEQKPNVNFIGGGPVEMPMMNLQDAFNEMLPKKQKKRKMKIKEAKKILIEQESNKLLDTEKIHEEAIRKTEEAGIIFIDEIDKIAAKGSDSGSVSRQGVQRDLLPIVEGSNINTKYGTVNSNHILFIGSGAFHMSKPSDLIPELQGRFPIRVELDSLTQKDFYLILKTPKNALIKQYQALLATEQVSLEFEEEAIEEIAAIAHQANAEIENIGARRLHTVLTQLLNDYLFEIPDTIPKDSKVVVTKAMVHKNLKDLLKNRDMSHYIL